MTELAPPRVPADALDGWRLIEDDASSPVSVGRLGVATRTLVYEDAALAATANERVGIDLDGLCRVFVAGRLSLTPSPPHSRTLTRLVSARTSDRFATSLRERGFRAAEATTSRDFDVGGSEGRLTRYEALCDARDDATGPVLDVTGWLAVWPVTAGFLFAGGTYPAEVREGDRPPATASLADVLDPDAFREELFELVRGVED